MPHKGRHPEERGNGRATQKLSRAVSEERRAERGHGKGPSSRSGAAGPAHGRQLPKRFEPSAPRPAPRSREEDERRGVSRPQAPAPGASGPIAEDDLSRMAGEGGDRVGHQQEEGEDHYEGFHGVHRGRGKGPKGYTRSDERIREDVCDRIVERESLDASDVEVTVRDGEVTLSGTVPRRAMKWELEQLTEEVSGVRDVHVMLRVRKEGQPPLPSTDSREMASKRPKPAPGQAPGKRPGR